VVELDRCKSNFNAVWRDMGMPYAKKYRVDNLLYRLSTMHESDRQRQTDKPQKVNIASSDVA